MPSIFGRLRNQEGTTRIQVTRNTPFQQITGHTKILPIPHPSPQYQTGRSRLHVLGGSGDPNAPNGTKNQIGKAKIFNEPGTTSAKRAIRGNARIQSPAPVTRTQSGQCNVKFMGDGSGHDITPDPPVVRLGDVSYGHGFPSRPCDTASPNVYANNILVHRQGDHWVTHCLGPSCHDGVLAEGSHSVFVNNKQIARVGDQISCGDGCKTGSPNVFSN